MVDQALASRTNSINTDIVFGKMFAACGVAARSGFGLLVP